MIKKLTGKNFQSLRDVEYEFHPGVNVLSGPTDAGKSATVRLIKWIIDNSPAGDAYRRHETSKTSGTLDAVSKHKTASKHYYKCDGQMFKAIRSSVPDEIRNVLRLDLNNFQGQHDAYFLIRDSPGQVAKTLNNVADLQIIDQSRQLVKQRIKDAKNRKESLREDVKEKEEKIASLQWVKAADRLYSEIEDLQMILDHLKIEELQEKIDQVLEYQELVDSFPDIAADLLMLTDLKKEADVDLSIVEVLEVIEENSREYPDIKADLKQLNQLSEEFNVDLSFVEILDVIEKNQVNIPDPKADLDFLNRSLEDLNSEKIQEIEELLAYVGDAQEEVNHYPEEIDDLTEIIAMLRETEKQIEDLTELVSECVIAEDCAEEAATVYLQGKKEFSEKMRSLGKCPLCEGDLK